MDGIDIIVLIVVAVISIAGSIIKKKQQSPGQTPPTPRKAFDWETMDSNEETWRHDREGASRVDDASPPDSFPGPAMPYDSKPAITPAIPSSIPPPVPYHGIPDGRRTVTKATSSIESDHVSADGVLAGTSETAGILHDFDLRTAIIYSEILRPKFDGN